MKNFLVYLAVLNFLVLSNVKSQDLALQWHNFYGSEDKQFLKKAISLEDGYLLVGTQLSNTNIIKLDLDYAVIWDKQYNGFFIDVIEEQDGFVLGGGRVDFEVLKISKSGEEVWRKSYGGTEKDELFSIVEYNDGHLLIGYTWSNDGDVTNNYGGADGWVLNIDKQGELIWERTYGTEDREEFYKCLVGEDFFLFIGRDNQMLKTDFSGDIIFDKILADTTFYFLDSGNHLTTDSGDFIVPGFMMFPGRRKSGILKLSDEGEIIWVTTFGNDQASEIITQLKETDTGVIEIIGSSITHFFPHSYSQLRYAEIDLDGTLLRSEALFELLESNVRGISILDSDSCPFLFTGISSKHENNEAFDDYGLFCFDEMLTSVDNSATQSDIKIYPNPSDGLVTVELNASLNGWINVTNSLGEQILTDKISSSSHTLDLGSAANGIYFINIQSTDNSKQTESFVQKISLIR